MDSARIRSAAAGRSSTSFSRRRPSRSSSSTGPHESPFNVGVVLPLDDFLPEQVARLNALHPRPLDDADIQRLYALVGGHPYLTRKALYMVAAAHRRATVDELVRAATEDTGPFGDHLRYYLLRLQRKPELIAALRQTIEGHGGGDELLDLPAAGAGLVRRDGQQGGAALRALRAILPRAAA